MRWVVRWRLALRIARREALRHPLRTLLVVAMVGLPITAVVTADTLLSTRDVTPVEALPATLGAADVRITGEARGPVTADPVSGALYDPGQAGGEPWARAEVAGALPPGSRVVEAGEAQLAHRTGNGYTTVLGWADDLADPIRDGAAELVAGRLPRAAGEVAVSPDLADRGAAVGEELLVTRDDVPVQVVGVLRTPQRPGPLIVLPPAAADLLGESRATFYATVPGGLDWPAVQELNRQGLVAVSREVVRDPPPEGAWLPAGTSVVSGGGTVVTAVLALIVVLVVLAVVLLAGPAFAVSARRQRRDLALVAAAGAAPADLRRLVLGNGVVLGSGAALAGAALGVGLARGAVPLIADRWDVAFGPFEVPWTSVALTVAVGVGAVLVAAWFPARQAARADVVDALAGRRARVRTSWRSPVLGLLLAGAGTVLVIFGARGSEFGVAAGAVLLIAGAVVATPWLVGLLAPAARWLPVAGRLAVRDATRNRGRTVPAVAAVTATVAGVTALAIGSASDSAQAQRDYQPQAPMGAAVISMDPDADTSDDVEAAVAAQLPGRAVGRVQGSVWRVPAGPGLVVTEPGCTGPIPDCQWFDDAAVAVSLALTDVLVGDPDTAAALFPRELAADVAAALGEGRVVVLGKGAVDRQGQVHLTAVRSEEAAGGLVPLESVTLPAAEVPLPEGTAVSLPAPVVVPTALAGRLPVPVEPLLLVVGGPDTPVTIAEEERLAEMLGALSPSSSVYVERGWTDDTAIGRLLLVLLGGSFVLIATLTATGLALIDARPDLAALAAVGAAPGTRRRMAMAAAAVVGGGGALLGLLVGLGPGIAVAYPLTSQDLGGGIQPIVVIPWTVLGAVALAVPLLAVVVTGLSVRARLPMTTRLT
jgi:putative ABC transport system permease protein